MNTKEEILNVALSLFNNKSVKSVTTNHIAKEANISPGNLYYYYKNKEEIIRALFDIMIQDEYHICEQSTCDTLEELNNYFKNLFKVYQEYFFMRRDIFSLTLNDSILHEKFLKYQETENTETKKWILFLIKKEVIMDIDEKTVEFLTQNINFILLFWSPYSKLFLPKLNKNSLDEGLHMINSLIKPYVNLVQD